ncbi:MAG: 1,4-dihydroxy-2-naphthoate octaprenyltransferase [Acetobacteraceae bacterium]|nr:1,4-dihydroxy-2-naphthoate octaprenyltransferase [Acetobacteraceae bacterium]
MMKGFSLWTRAVRAPFFTASVVPVLLGAAVAWYQGWSLSWGCLALTLVGAVAAHAGANLANDFHDHVGGTDWINRYRSPFNGGAGLIQEGRLSPRTVALAAGAAYLVGALAGLALTWLRGWPVLALMLAGAALGVCYTAPPLRLSYRGVGELAVGLAFGPLLVLGSYYVQAGRFSWTPVLASLPVGFLITAVLYINQFPDVEPDRGTGKDNWVVRLGTARAFWGYCVLVAVPYLAILGTVLSRTLPVPALLGLLSLPLAARAVAVARRHHADPSLIVPSCALTVNTHLATGVLLAVGLVAGRWLGPVVWWLGLGG